jgi:hypothetical protein
MLSASIRKRRQSLKLINSAGAEVRADFGKSIPRQMLEISLLGLRGYSAADYYLLGLYKGTSKASKFMTLRQYNEVRRKLNKQVCGIIEFNKWVFGKYCESVGIPTPQCYGVFHKEIGFARDLRPLRGPDELWAFLIEINRPFAIKPLAGDRGENVRIFDSIDVRKRTLTGANGVEIGFDDFHRGLISQEEPWLLQEKVIQHPVLGALHASSVNSARIITLRNDEGEVTILAAALRIGVGMAEVDNTTGGGLAAHVDLASGVCDAATSRSSIRTVARHPDTGCDIEGLVLPYWTLVTDTARRAHRSLPFARSLGWDVAFGLAGPVVLEVNGSWYYNRVQMTGQSLWETAFGNSRAAQSVRRG